MTIRLDGNLLAVAGKRLGDVLDDLHLDLLGEVELSEDLLLPPHRSGSVLVVEPMLGCSRLEPFNAHIIKSDNLSVLRSLHHDDHVVQLPNLL